MSIETEIALDLLERLEEHLGYLPPIEQVDIWEPEDEDDDAFTANIYWGPDLDTDVAELCFSRPETAFDSDAIERAMKLPIDSAVLAEELMRRADKFRK